MSRELLELEKNLGQRANDLTTEVTDKLVWKGRPSIGPYLALNGVLALVLIVVLVGLELLFAGRLLGPSAATASLSIGAFTIPYALEAITVGLIVFGYVVSVLGLVILRARNSYELRTDGLYIKTGIANLEDIFVSPIAFSDARLIRTISMRLLGRSEIIVEANDKRRFEMKMIKDGPVVQSLIRSNLAHPTVRLERQIPPVQQS
jgi:hypothetical protein